MPFLEDELATKLVRLQETRDNIIYLLSHEELSDTDTLHLETQLSSVEDEIVLLRLNNAA